MPRNAPPKGPVKLDKYGMAIQIVYIRETENVDGGMGIGAEV